MKEMQAMMDAMRAELSGGGFGGGRDDGLKKEIILQADNTVSTPGWVQWSSKGEPHWKRREKYKGEIERGE